MLGKNMEFKLAETRYHSVAPTVIDCGGQAGKICVFSLFEDGDPGPTMYFDSFE